MCRAVISLSFPLRRLPAPISGSLAVKATPPYGISSMPTTRRTAGQTEDLGAHRKWFSKIFRRTASIRPTCSASIRRRVIGCSIRREEFVIAGDSREKIAALLVAAQAKKAFYEALKKKPAPPLEGDLWLNTGPIRLEDLMGKSIQLHFWSISCGPCHELLRLEQEWGHSPPGPGRRAGSRRGDHVFISIHPYVDGDGLQRLLTCSAKSTSHFQ